MSIGANLHHPVGRGGAHEAGFGEGAYRPVCARLDCWPRRSCGDDAGKGAVLIVATDERYEWP